MGELREGEIGRMKNIYSWDFRSICRRTYLLLNGLHIDSCYTDCLAEDFVDRVNRVDKSIFERPYFPGFYESMFTCNGLIWRHQWGRESDS